MHSVKAGCFFIASKTTQKHKKAKVFCKSKKSKGFLKKLRFFVKAKKAKKAVSVSVSVIC